MVTKHNFLHRTQALLGTPGLEALGRPCVAISGLGVVGGAAFLTMVRCGIKNFRLAENGIFDPPDMNRQWGALGSTVGEAKLEVYCRWAREINPEVRMELYPGGINVENIESFLTGSDIYVGVIDAEKGQDVKEKSNEISRRLKIPAFTAGAIGFGAVMINYDPEGMSAGEFWRNVSEKSDRAGFFPSYLYKNFEPVLMRNILQAAEAGVLATSSVGGGQAGVMLASEIITYILRGSGLVQRKAVFAPQFVTLDLMQMNLSIEDVTAR